MKAGSIVWEITGLILVAFVFDISTEFPAYNIPSYMAISLFSVSLCDGFFCFSLQLG